MRAIIFFFIVIPSLSMAQGDRIELEQLPRLDTVWGSVEYKQILLTFYDATQNQVPLPRMHDSYYKDFYTKLLDKRNLNIFTDSTFTTADRFQMGSPFFDILPTLLVLLTDQMLYNEAVVVEEFLMETMLQSTYLMKDYMHELPDSLKADFALSVKNEKAIYQCTMGTLQVLSLEKDEDGVDFRNLVSLAQWSATHMPSLWEWMDDLQQQDCLTQIRSLTKTHPSPEIRSLMQELLVKLAPN